MNTPDQLSTILSISQQIERGELSLRIMHLFLDFLRKGWALGDDLSRDDSYLFGVKLSSTRIAYSLWQYLARVEVEGIPQEKPPLHELVDLLDKRLGREAYHEELSGENGASAILYQMIAEHFRLWPNFKECFVDYLKQIEAEKVDPVHATEKPQEEPVPALVLEQTLSASQQRAFDFCYDLGRLFFGGTKLDTGFGLRTFPLLVGPTGAGKNFVVRRLAKALNCHYLPLNYGSWLPQGSRKGTNTVDLIAATAMKHHRLLIHLDELDKLRGNFNSGWDISICNEIWDLLDQNISSAHLESAQFPARDHEKVLSRIRRRVWIVGSGTWQTIFEGRSKSMGFTEASSPPAERESIIDEIFGRKLVPSELLARFNSRIQLLSYPDANELLSFLNALEISLDDAQAAKLSERIQRSGFRSVEDLVTEHCIGLLPSVAEAHTSE